MAFKFSKEISCRRNSLFIRKKFESFSFSCFHPFACRIFLVCLMDNKRDGNMKKKNTVIDSVRHRENVTDIYNVATYNECPDYSYMH